MINGELFFKKDEKRINIPLDLKYQAHHEKIDKLSRCTFFHPLKF